MKRGTEYARRIKRLFPGVAGKSGRAVPHEPTDPLEQLIIGILSDCSTLARARAVFRRLCQHMVDLNELRVTPAPELAALIGAGVPLAEQKAQRIVDLLNDVRRRQDKLDLSFLRQRGRREAREYLESLAGSDRSAAAVVVLYSLGGHAIPVDDLTLYVLRKEDLVDPSADAAEVQGFLERNISAANAQAFVEALGKHVASKASRVPVESLGQLLSPAPAEPAAAATSPAAATAPEEPPQAEREKKRSEKKAGAARSSSPRGKPSARKKPAKTSRPPGPAHKKPKRRARQTGRQ